MKKIFGFVVMMFALTLLFAAPADAQIRIGLGGYLQPLYNKMTTLIGERPYAYDVGANMYPDSHSQAVNYPSGMPQLLHYDKAVAIGVEFLTPAVIDAIEESDEPVVVAGISMGSIVIDHYLASLENDPNAPSPDDVEFITYADPQRGVLRLLPDDMQLPGYQNAPVPETPYDVTVIYSEYEGFSDPPDRPWNVVATTNAVMGAWQIHGTEIYADLDDVPEENIFVEENTKGGVTTTYRIPAEELPITKPLRVLLPSVLVDKVDDIVRPVIDRGYSRNDEPGDDRPILRNGRLHSSEKGD